MSGSFPVIDLSAPIAVKIFYLAYSIVTGVRPKSKLNGCSDKDPIILPGDTVRFYDPFGFHGLREKSGPVHVPNPFRDTNEQLGSGRILANVNILVISVRRVRFAHTYDLYKRFEWVHGLFIPQTGIDGAVIMEVML